MTGSAGSAPENVIVPSISPAELDRLEERLDDSDRRATWWVDLAQRVEALGEGLAVHRAEAEGVHGLHAQLVRDSPRLAAAVARLDEDHDDLEVRVRRARALIGEAAGDPEAEGAIIAEVRALVERMRRHQETAFQVVSDAYNVDLGGE